MKTKTKVQDLFESGVLKIKKGRCTSVVLDVEIDPMNCEINEDGVITIDVSKYQYIMLDFDVLDTLLKLIEDSESYYYKKNKKLTKL